MFPGSLTGSDDKQERLCVKSLRLTVQTEKYLMILNQTVGKEIN